MHLIVRVQGAVRVEVEELGDFAVQTVIFKPRRRVVVVIGDVCDVR